MKEFKGTPGPWKFNRHDKYFHHFGDIEGSYGIGDKGIENIRTIAVLTNYAGEDESNANAKLFAASKQMLEALQEMVKQFGHLNTNNANSRAIEHSIAALSAALD